MAQFQELIGRDDGLSTLCHSCRFGCQHKVLKPFPALAILTQWMGSLNMAFTGKFVYTAHHFILLWLNLFDLRVERGGW